MPRVPHLVTICTSLLFRIRTASIIAESRNRLFRKSNLLNTMGLYLATPTLGLLHVR